MDDMMVKYIDKVVAQRQQAMHLLIMEPSAENAGRLREINGQLSGMMAMLNMLDDKIVKSERKHLDYCRDIIEKTI